MAGIAVVFAGQGAQSVGMGRDLAEASEGCRRLFERADEVLGYGLSQICFEGPETELTKSNHCQPAIFTVSTACYAALRERMPDVEFVGTGGLSLGEWSALHMAGALSFEDTLRVLEARGRFMQEACEARDGAMVSVIGLDETAIEDICTRTGTSVSNLNCPGQTVISGERAGVVQAAEQAEQAGAKRAVMLNVAGAYHSPLMAPAAERLGAYLADVDIAMPRIPVVSNVSGRLHGGPDEIRAAMTAQVTSSVRWIDCVESLKAEGASTLLECGPGKVLSGLAKRIDSELTLNSIQDASSLDGAVAALQSAAQ